MNEMIKHISILIGGAVGWLIAEFRPTFPLVLVATVFMVYDAFTAYQLGRRVAKTYPEKSTDTKFTSFAFGKLVRETIPKRLALIFLAFLVEKWVFVFMDIPLSYIVTGIICFEQAWSILENESSCRGEADSMFWRLLQKIMVDKTSRHFDINLAEMIEAEKKQTKENI